MLGRVCLWGVRGSGCELADLKGMSLWRVVVERYVMKFIAYFVSQSS